MLSAAKHLYASRDRPFAEFTLSEAHGLRVTLDGCSNWQGLFFTIEPCLTSERNGFKIDEIPSIARIGERKTFPSSDFCKD
jgi:hypothetical protein